MLTIACVLHRRDVGKNEYDAEYVRRLRDGVREHLPHRFVCLSNVDVPCERIELKHGWPGWWAKMELFRPDIFQDDHVLYFDLDTLIVDNIDDLAKVTKFTVIGWPGEPWRQGSGSGLMYLTDRTKVWNEWMKVAAERIAGRRGDGRFIVPFAEQTWHEALPGRVVSYKKHCMDGIPEGASVVCFHGRPRPRDVNWSCG